MLLVDVMDAGGTIVQVTVFTPKLCVKIAFSLILKAILDQGLMTSEGMAGEEYIDTPFSLQKQVTIPAGAPVLTI